MHDHTNGQHTGKDPRPGEVDAAGRRQVGLGNVYKQNQDESAAIRGHQTPTHANINHQWCLATSAAQQALMYAAGPDPQGSHA